MSNITLQQMIYVVAVDDRGSFVDAAEECRVSQPALSMQIRKLENTLGVTLFDRSRQPIRPTDVGRRVIAQARQVLNAAGRVQEIADVAQGEMKGEFRLGVEPTVGPYLLPLFLRRFLHRHPTVSLTIEEGTTATLLDRVTRESIDAAILPSIAPGDAFEDRLLFREALYLYVPRTSMLYGRGRVPLAQLEDLELMLLPEGYALRDTALEFFGGALVKEGARGRLRVTASSLETLRRMVEEGFGSTVVPYLVALEVRATGIEDMLVEVSDPAPQREVRLVSSRAGAKGHMVDALAEAVRDALPAGLRGEESRPRRTETGEDLVSGITDVDRSGIGPAAAGSVGGEAP